MPAVLKRRISLLIHFGDKEYRNYFTPIEKTKIELFPIEYDEKFIEEEYKPKLAIIEEALEKGVAPWILQERLQTLV